jgi:aryl-alcohol dehydrogenase-like predicted oxidoreductase
MDRISFGKSDLRVSEAALGTWVTGGWAWGGSDEAQSLEAIHRALELGFNFIDTAPVYGFGRSEEIVGKALKQWGRRDEVVIATKCGLDWDDEHKFIQRNSSPERIMQEVDDSLRRLGVERIDILQIHWPDPKIPFESSLETLTKAREAGKIRYIGLSNFSRDQLEECLKYGEILSLQPPYNIFERAAENDVLPFCVERGIATLVYGGLCRGLLSGKFTGDEKFAKGDLRRGDPKFKPDRFRQYVKATEALKKVAAKYGKTLAQFSLRWTLQQPGVTTVIAGARTPQQAEDNAGVSGWRIEPEDIQQVDAILGKFIKTPVGPEFMAPGLS